MPSPFGGPQAGDTKTPPKYAVRASYTGNVANLAAATTTCDTSVTLVEGDFVLLCEQTDHSQDGIYIVGVVASGLAPLTRASFADSSASLPNGTEVVVQSGTARGGKKYTLTTANPITLGTTSLAFVAGPTLAAVTSLETRLSADEVVGELSSASVYNSLTSRVSTAESTATSLTATVSSETSKTTSLTTRASTGESVEISSAASLTTRLSQEESARASAAASLTTRVSDGLSVDVSATASLNTRVSTGLSVDVSATTSLDTRISTEASTRTSADASLAVIDSTNLSTLTSSVVSLTTRLSSEESKLSSHIVAGH